MTQTLADDGSRRHVLFLSVSVRLANKPLNHTRQSSTIRLCARRQVARHLCIKATCLTSSRMNTPVRGKIGEHHHKPFFQSHQTDQVHKEGFARPILPDHETDGGAAVRDAFHVLHKFFDLANASYLNMTQAQFWHDPRPQSLNNCIALTWLQFRHDAPPLLIFVLPHPQFPETRHIHHTRPARLHHEFQRPTR